LDANIKNTEILQEKEIDRLKNEIKNLEEKKSMRDEEMKKLDNSIKAFEENMQEQEKFECEKIGTNCPFIKVINKKTFENLQEQKDKLYAEKNLLVNKIKDEDIDEKIKDAISKIKDIEKESKNGDNNAKEVKDIQDKIDFIKEFLNKIDYKNI
jgi:chlorite dismutase